MSSKSDNMFERQLNHRVEMAQKVKEIETKTGKELTEQEFIKVLEKAEKIQKEQEKKKKTKKIIKNAIEDDFSKGAARNQLCPLCKTKLKKCICGFLIK
jgi:hypothetical protein